MSRLPGGRPSTWAFFGTNPETVPALQLREAYVILRNGGRGDPTEVLQESLDGGSMPVVPKQILVDTVCSSKTRKAAPKL